MSKTQYLLHFDSTDMKDFTKNGNIRVASNIKKFGNSLYLDGSSWMSLNCSKLDLINCDWSMDWWGYIEGTTGFGGAMIGDSVGVGFAPFTIRGTYNSSSSSVQMCSYFHGSDLDGAWNIYSDNYYGSMTVSMRAWHHFYIGVIDKQKVYVAIDGVIQKEINHTSSKVGNLTGSDKELRIGRVETDGTQYFVGYIDEFRIVKGTCKWTTNFTPPIRAYSEEIGNLNHQGRNKQTVSMYDEKQSTVDIVTMTDRIAYIGADNTSGIATVHKNKIVYMNES